MHATTETMHSRHLWESGFLFEVNNTRKLLIFPPENYALAVVASLQIIIGAVSNALVIATISLGQRYVKAPSDILALNLSFADLLPCLTFLPWVTFQLIQGEGFHERIIFLQGIYSSLRLCGENAVFAVMLDRYVATCLPLRYRAIITRKRTFLFTALFIWLFGFSIGLAKLVAVLLNLVTELVWVHSIMNLLTFISICAMHGSIFRQTRRQLKKISLEGVGGSNVMQRRKRQKLLLILKSANKALMFALSFFITFLQCPVVFFATYSDRMAHNSRIILIWQVRVSCFAFLHSCINPFIYSFRNTRFNEMFRRMINRTRRML